jgi:hypothetical protein
MSKRHVNEFVGRTLLQVVSRWLLTSEIKVQSQVSPRTVYGRQSDIGAVFSEHFGFHSYNFISALYVSIIRIKCKLPQQTLHLNSHRFYD